MFFLLCINIKKGCIIFIVIIDDVGSVIFRVRMYGEKECVICCDCFCCCYCYIGYNFGYCNWYCFFYCVLWFVYCYFFVILIKNKVGMRKLNY